MPENRDLFEDLNSGSNSNAEFLNRSEAFGQGGAVNRPWAEQMRPKTLKDVVGQAHLLAEGMPLERMISTGRLNSMLLWGPPGVGKTTLANLLARRSGCQLIALSAVMSGVKDIRQALEQAMQLASVGKGCVLFVDEIHRFNKGQQDALLPFVESGLVTFIGATTENPSFEVNSALLSRAQVYVLETLVAADFDRLLARIKILHPEMPSLTPETQAVLVDQSDGDARRYINALQALTLARSSAEQPIERHELDSVLSQGLKRFDKKGDQYYDQISALHKTVRGSDPDAALYWFCRMMDVGTDPHYLARRLIRMAWEDIGLADPRALTMAETAAKTYERLGSPEGDLALAECVIYLAVAPKSNAGYVAFKKARAYVKQTGTWDVPKHLRNAPAQLMKDLGHGEGYRYAHDEPGGHAAGENYWPAQASTQSFYTPTDRGLEQQIAEKLKELNKRSKRR